MKKKLTHGCFSGLAENYSKYRPSYSQSVLSTLFSLLEKPVNEIEFVDVGAGTGIWSRMVVDEGVKSAISIEPNDDMRFFGIADSKKYKINWIKGSGESTGLNSSSVDFLSMASSFHWVDFEKGTKEFARILRSGGRFVALWNPRYIEANPILVEIEDKLKEFIPDLRRFSSGRSGVTATLTNQLWESSFFDDVIYIEGRHTVKQIPEDYLGVWWSVNDIRAQAGEKFFSNFMRYVETRIKGLDYIETTYLTRAWTARRV